MLQSICHSLLCRQNGRRFNLTTSRFSERNLGRTSVRPHVQAFKLKMKHINLGIPQALELAKKATIHSWRKMFGAPFSSTLIVQVHGLENSMHSFLSISTTLRTNEPFSRFAELYDYPFVLSNFPNIPSSYPASLT